MFCLTVVFGPAATNWRLLYKDGEKAQAAFNLLSRTPNKTTEFNPDTRVQLVDDFGQRVFFNVEQVCAAMVENLDESKIGVIEFSLHHARVQANTQQRAEADPGLRAAAMSRGPAMISPMANGGRFPG